MRSKRCVFRPVCCALVMLCFNPAAPAAPQTGSATIRGQGPARALRDTGRQRRQNERTARMVRVLNRTVAHVEFDGTLEEVIDWFRDHGVRNMIINWALLDQAGSIGRDTPVQLVLEDVTLGELLDVVLDLVSSYAAVPDEELTYHVTRGILRIAPRASFDRQIYTRTYYVEDLLLRATANELAPYFVTGSEYAYVRELRPVVASGAAAQAPITDVIPTGTKIGPGGPEYGVPDYDQIREEELEQLITLLQSVRPETWDIGGGRGTITPFGENLIITQTVEMHEIIGGAFCTDRPGHP